MNGKGVIRGGFGMAFDRFDNVSFDNSRDNPPFVANYGFCCGGPGTPPPPVDAQIQYALGTNPASPLSFPANPALATGINPVSNLPIILPGQGAPNVYANSQTFNNPYIYLYSLDLQYALPKNWVAYDRLPGQQQPRAVAHPKLAIFLPDAESADRRGV